MDMYTLIGHLLLLFLAPSIVAPQSTEYVLEGRDVTLKCRMSPPIPKDARLYWLGPGAGSLDNYAIDNSTYHQDYRVELDRSAGRYDLSISRATYNRNNGQFRCRMRTEGGFSRELHSEAINLTVLIKPGSPRIDPLRPSVIQGSQIRLTCSSKGGSPDPEIIWYRKSDGKPLKESLLKPGGSRDVATTSSLTLRPSRDDDGEEFMCEVRNRALPPSEKMVTSVTLSVDYYPIVRIFPANPVRVIRGQDVTLKCEVDAKPAARSIQWRRDGILLRSEPELTLSRVDSGDSGRYICQADNNLGRPGEAEVTVDVLYPPLVAVPPPREVALGDDVIIACNVTSNPPPDYVYWTKMDDSRFRQNTELLRLSKIEAIDHGTYVCHAVSVLSPSGGLEITLEGNATTEIRVRHAPGRSHIRPPRPVAVEAKEKVLTCGATPPGYPDTQYRWWREGEVIMTIGENYTIPRASAEHVGEYYCQPFNLLGNGTVASTNLRVFRAPRITEGLKPTAVYRRDRGDLRLSCRAEGNPLPDTKWLKDDLEIKPSDGLFDVITNVTQLGPGLGFVIQTILFFRGPERVAGGRRALRPEDRGTYQCSFENEAERVSSSQLLRVQHPPALAHRVTRVAADLTEDASLVCRMRSHPPPSFKWSHNGNILEEGSLPQSPGSSLTNANRPVGSQGRYRVSNTDLGGDVFESVLTVSAVVREDYGSYKCEATNREGSTKTLLALQPKGVPGPPEADEAKVGVDEVRIAFEPGFDGGFPVLLNHSVRIEPDRPGLEKRTVQCDPRKKSSNREDSAIDHREQLLECLVSDLNPDTGYRLFLFSENPRGRSPLSEPLIVRTWIDPKGIPAPTHVLVDPGLGQTVLAVPSLSKISHVELEARFQVKHFGTVHYDGNANDGKLGGGRVEKTIPHSGDSLEDGSLWVDLPNGVPLTGLSDGGAITHNFEQQLTNDTKLRARVCVIGKLDVCGKYTEASYVSELPVLVSSTAGPTKPLVVVIVVVVVFVAVCAFVAIVCCCYKRSRNLSGGLKKKKKVVAGGAGSHHRGGTTGQQQAPPPPYYTVGLENKGMDQGSFDHLDEHSKSLIFAANQQHQHQQYQNLAPNSLDPAAYLESNGGGSVHSQDSLWRVKGGPHSYSQTPLGGGDFAQQGAPHPPHSPVSHHHDRIVYPGYPGVPYNQTGTYDDYAHYPPIGNGYPIGQGVDPYGMSPQHYTDGVGPDDGYDVNGMSSPYMGAHHQMGAADISGLPPMTPQEGLRSPHLGVDESMESGFSTPNSRSRRVIREIIV